MKNQYQLKLFAITALSLFASATASAALGLKLNHSPDGSETREVAVSIQDAFIPSGFDSASDAYVVVNGLFPNTCYEWKQARVDSDGDFEHEIRSFANVRQGVCLMMMVPFTKEVSLGKLAKGTHQLKFVSGDGTFLQKQMTID